MSAGNSRDGGPPLPRSFVFELTRRCNNECGYCYNVWRAPELGYQGGGELTAARLREIILKLEEETAVEAIFLSGGEPLLREDLPEIVRFIRSRGIRCTVITNGTLLGEEQVEALEGVGRYEVPLLSCRPEVHDLLVGRRGAWDAVLEGMMNVHLAAIPLSAVFISTPQNFADLQGTARLAMLLGADQFVYKRVNVGRFNLRRADQLLLKPAMLEENLRTLEVLAAREGFPVSIDLIVEPCLLDMRRFPHLEPGWCPLAGEDSAFVIDPAGNVRICEHSPRILGNILRERFQDLYRHPDVHAFRCALPPECENCTSDLRDKCRGGCKAAADQTYGSILRMDPYVALTDESYPLSHT